MSKLIEANEFGDWLMGEIAQAKAQSASVHPDVALGARLRLENLKTAKKTLLEFLKIQQAMFQAASAARRKMQAEVPLQDAMPTPSPKRRSVRTFDGALVDVQAHRV